jgi:hypothetical protein
MTNFIQDVEQLGETILADVKLWAGEAEDFLVHEGEAAWAAVKAVLTALPSNAWAALLPLAQEAVAEVGAGTATVDTVGAKLLNKAESAGILALHTLEENLFTGVVSSLITAAKAAL